MTSNKYKQKNELVFKLLKTMNPFLNSDSNEDTLRSSINQILAKQKNQHIQASDSLSELSAITQQMHQTNLQNFSAVYNFKIQSLSPETQRKIRQAKQRQQRFRRQLINRGVNRQIRNQITSIHQNINQKYYGSSNSLLNTIESQKMYGSTLPTSSTYESQKIYGSCLPTASTLERSDYQIQTSRDNYRSKVFEISECYSRNTSSVYKISDYRHETRKKEGETQPPNSHTKSKSNFFKIIDQTKTIGNNSHLSIESKKQSQVARSKSALIINKKRAINPCRMNPENGVNPERRRQYQSLKKRNTSVKECSSQKVLKQAHQLDIEVMGSLLFRKLNKSPVIQTSRLKI